MDLKFKPLPQRSALVSGGNIIYFPLMLLARISARLGKPSLPLAIILGLSREVLILSPVAMSETCIVPVLLCGCETWLLDSTTIKSLEKFQCEIGRRVLRVPKHHSKTVMRLASQWPSVLLSLISP